MSALWECQKSIYDALVNNSTFMNLIGSRIYDEPPTNCQYPFVTIGDGTEISDNRLTYNGYDVTITLHIYTKPEGLGFYPAKKILESINAVINVKRLSMTNLTMLLCKLDNIVTERDDDKRIISARYRIVAHSDTLNTL